MNQLHIFYSGNVQGIGFRITAKRIADQIGVSGWVKNLPDGRVELIMQGDEKALSKMKNMINNKFYNYMQTVETKREEISSICPGFEIR